MNATSEIILAFCGLCHHVDDDPHHHWCRKLLRHTQSWWQVFSRDQTRVVWNYQTTSLESYHFTLLTDVNIIYLPMPNSFGSHLFVNSCLVKVRQFQNEFMKSLFLPKYERKIVRISALCSEVNFLFVIWEKRWLHKFILKSTEL